MTVSLESAHFTLTVKNYENDIKELERLKLEHPEDAAFIDELIERDRMQIKRLEHKDFDQAKFDALNNDISYKLDMNAKTDRRLWSYLCKGYFKG